MAANASSAARVKALQEQSKKDRKHIKKREQELRRKDKALAEAAALLVLEKRKPRRSGGRRGPMIGSADRRQAVALIEEAVSADAGQRKACAVLGISARPYQRWTQGEAVLSDRHPAAQLPVLANKFSEEEREEILNIVNTPALCSMQPSQIVPALADQGRYLASESTLYRVSFGQPINSTTGGAVRRPNARSRALHERWSPVG